MSSSFHHKSRSKISCGDSELDLSCFAAEAMDCTDPFPEFQDCFVPDSWHSKFEVWDHIDAGTALAPKSDTKNMDNSLSRVPQPEILTSLESDETFNPSAFQDSREVLPLSSPHNGIHEENENAWLNVLGNADEAMMDPGRSCPSFGTSLSSQMGDESTAISEQDSRRGSFGSEEGNILIYAQTEAVEAITPANEEEENAVSLAARRARSGQKYWSKELARTKAEWHRLRVDALFPAFQTHIAHALRTFRSQKVCTLMKLHIAAAIDIISLDLDHTSGEIKAFCVLPARAPEFRAYFDPGLTYKSFCSLFRRAGFLPDGRAWDASFRGEAWLRQSSGRVATTES